MNRLLYLPLYFIAILPFSFLYFLSDCVYFLLYYVFQYQKKIVRINLVFILLFRYFFTFTILSSLFLPREALWVFRHHWFLRQVVPSLAFLNCWHILHQPLNIILRKATLVICDCNLILFTCAQLMAHHAYISSWQCSLFLFSLPVLFSIADTFFKDVENVNASSNIILIIFFILMLLL